MIILNRSWTRVQNPRLHMACGDGSTSHGQWLGWFLDEQVSKHVNERPAILYTRDSNAKQCV